MSFAEYKRVKSVGLKVQSFIYKLMVKVVAANPSEVAIYGESIRFEVISWNQDRLLLSGNSGF